MGDLSINGLEPLGGGLGPQGRPSVGIGRDQDGKVTSVTVTGAAPFCGAPPSVSMTVGKDGQIHVKAKSGFINPESFGSDRPHAPTKSQLTWLKSEILKCKDLSDAEKANFALQIDALIEKAPEKAPDTLQPLNPPPGGGFEDSPQFRKLLGDPKQFAAEASFPDVKKR